MWQDSLSKLQSELVCRQGLSYDQTYRPPILRIEIVFQGCMRQCARPATSIVTRSQFPMDSYQIQKPLSSSRENSSKRNSILTGREMFQDWSNSDQQSVVGLLNAELKNARVKLPMIRSRPISISCRFFRVSDVVRV